MNCSAGSIGAVERNAHLGPHPVIGDRLDVVILGRELAQLATDPRLVSRQPGKLGMHALVGFGVLPVRTAINTCAA
jgi:hypothetical protein